MMLRYALCATVLAACSIGQAQQSSAFRKQDIKAGVVLLPSPGTLGTPYTPYIPSSSPHILYNLDSNTTAKPAGWNIFNPRSSGTLNVDDYSRWSAQDPSINTASFLARVTSGLRLQKSFAAYWEVKIDDASDLDLSDYDLLVLSPRQLVGDIQIDGESREKLRKFVDKGGVLWVDTSAASFDIFNGSPVPFNTTGVASSSWIANFTHPLLSVPIALNLQDLNLLHSSGTAVVRTPGAVYSGAVAPLILPLLGAENGLGGQPTGDYAKLQPVASVLNSPTIGVTRIGEGYVVVTTRDVAPALNRTSNDASYITNLAFNAKRPTLTQQGGAAAKLAVNLINLASEASQSGAGSRRSGSTAVDLGAPLSRNFSDTYPAGQAPAAAPWVPRPPVIYKGMTFVVGQNQIFVYDTNPRNDIDKDGNPDDGIADLSLGESKDLIFRTELLGTQVSSAVCVEVPDVRNATYKDQLLVTDAIGRLHVYPIFGGTLDGSQNKVGITVTGATSPVSSSLNPPFPPTVHEGLAYVAYTTSRAPSNQGAFWVADLRTLQPMVSPATGNTFGFGGGNDGSTKVPEWSSSPIVGYIPIQEGSGGYDKVLYAPTMGDSSYSAGFVSLWLGAKGERPADVKLDSSDLLITTRLLNRQNLRIFNPGVPHPLGFRITAQDVNGVPLSPSQMEIYFTGSVSSSDPATLRVGLTPAGVSLGEAFWNGRIRIDYSLDWGFSDISLSYNVLRGRIQFPVNPNVNRQIVTGLALSPGGTLFATTSARAGTAVATAPTSITAAGGTLFAVKELDLGQFQLAYRWDLAQPGLTFSPRGSSAYTVPDPLPDNDPVQYLQFGAFSLGNFLGGALRNATFIGGPVVRNGNVYVTVIGQKNLARASALLCFQAEPPLAEINIPQNLVGTNFQIVQPDIIRASNPLAPTEQDESRIGSDRVIAERGDGNQGTRLRFTSFMGNVNGQILNSISTSMPIYIRVPGQRDDIVINEPMARGARWNPLQWYTILHGTAVNGPAFITGNTIFLSGASVLPKILDQVLPSDPNMDGVNIAIKADIDLSAAVPVTSSSAAILYPTPSDPDVVNFEPKTLVTDGSRAWLRQLISLDYPRQSGTGTIPWQARQFSDAALYPNANFVWPQNPRNSSQRGKVSFDDYKLRVQQTTLPTNNSFGSVGGDGALIAWNDQGVYGYRRSETWIADEGRVGLYDSTGNPLFDSTLNLRLSDTVIGSAGKISQLVRPTRVYPLAATGEVLIVDSGANRILKMSAAGLVSRTIESISVDSSYTPIGFKPGDSQTLSNPRDVTTFKTYVNLAQNVFTPKANIEEWTHYLIADSGNNRLIEVIDRAVVDASGNFISTIGTPATLVWQSPTEVSGRGFSYNSISVTYAPDNLNNFRPIYVAGVGGKLPGKASTGDIAYDPSSTSTDQTRVSSESSGGGIVIFDSTLPTQFTVINSFQVGAISALKRWNDVSEAWTVASDPQASTTSNIIPAANKPIETVRPFQNLQSVTVSYGRFDRTTIPAPQPVLKIMVADGTGVFEFGWNPTLPPATRSTQGVVTRWMITGEAFTHMRQNNTGSLFAPNFSPSAVNAGKFLPTYARRLDDENVLIVNGYSGLTRGFKNTGTGLWAIRPTSYFGEVVQIDGRVSLTADPRNTLVSSGFNFDSDNLGFNSRSIRFRLGPIEGARDLSLPVFADRK